MASEAVNNYITKRYERWLDYSFIIVGLPVFLMKQQMS